MKKSIKIYLIIAILFTTAQTLHANYYQRGRTYYVYKKFEKAKEMFLKHVEKGIHGDSYYFLGEIEKLQNNYDKAMEYYKIAATSRTSPKYKKNAYWNLIVISEANGKYDYLIKTCIYMWKHLHDSGAKHKIESIINKSLWTNNKNAILKYKEGKNLKNRGKIDEAKSKFQEALNEQSDFLAPKFEIGLIEYKRKNYSTAESYLNEIISVIPFYAEVHLILGNLLFKKKEYSSAINHFNKALELGFITKSIEYHIKYKRATSLYKSGDYEKAKEDIFFLLNIKKSFNILVLLSAIYIKEKNYKLALKFLNQANSIKKNNPIIIYKIGSIYYKQDNNRYLYYFDFLFDLLKNSENINDKYTRAFTILAKKHFENKQYYKVIRILEKISRNNYDILLLLAKSYYFTNKFEKSINIFKTISLDKESNYLYCKALYFTNDKSRAREILIMLINDDEYYKKAKKDRYLSSLIRDINYDKRKEKERKRLKEEKRLEKEKAEEDKRKRIEEEKRKDEEQKRLIEKEKKKEEKKNVSESEK
jgi:tetratricopeptide (TPR) repeat protein